MSAGLLEQCPECFRYGRLCAYHRATSARRHAANLRGLAAAIEAIHGDVAEIVEERPHDDGGERAIALAEGRGE